MKIILFAILSLLLCTGSFAAHQYTAINQNKGVGVKINETVNLSLSIDSGALPEGVTEFGYYYLDKKGQSTGVGAAFDLNKLFTAGSVSLGEFHAGESIVFWMKTSEGNYLDSYHRNGKRGEKYAAYVGNNGATNTSAIMGYDDFSGGWGPTDGASNSLEFTISGADASAPVGQPLPGVLATVLIGSGALGAAWKKRSAKRRV
ncbi:MAG: hypothetical protein PHS41_10595 [Victivallaceae bacterium]|nr:hypothetical protein [Victivallaceae bacterium]